MLAKQIQFPNIQIIDLIPVYSRVPLTIKKIMTCFMKSSKVFSKIIHPVHIYILHAQLTVFIQSLRVFIFRGHGISCDSLPEMLENKEETILPSLIHFPVSYSQFLDLCTVGEFFNKASFKGILADITEI
ncbi:hypothetical protein XELAEV_18015469mg [Xenopus laevis]|uniref:Uncharacterized protein n=1 Tax=Xenopus laevis TaxID=8355 RepID=A0A974DJ77_XENLA|nr:hypothetical protein XELAEV_18015469mg [Xenopus laevis]